jgi:hypothetical protein
MAQTPALPPPRYGLTPVTTLTSKVLSKNTMGTTQLIEIRARADQAPRARQVTKG